MIVCRTFYTQYKSIVTFLHLTILFENQLLVDLLNVMLMLQSLVPEKKSWFSITDRPGTGYPVFQGYIFFQNSVVKQEKLKFKFKLMFKYLAGSISLKKIKVQVKKGGRNGKIASKMR